MACDYAKTCELPCGVLITEAYDGDDTLPRYSGKSAHIELLDSLKRTQKLRRRLR